MHEVDVDIIPVDPRIVDLLRRATSGSAAYDLPALIDEPIRLKPGEQISMPGGFRMHIRSKNVGAFLLPRSGKGKKGLVLGNLVGLIDSDYQGVVTMILWNRSSEPIKIAPLDMVGQMVFLPVLTANLNVVDRFSEETERGEGGFGSTGG